MLLQQHCLEDVDWLLPVPSHHKRIRERGYNQVALLAKVLSKTTKIPILQNAVIRKNGQQSQVGLSKRLRAHNADGAFHWQGRSDSLGHIVIVDDLLTTGHTANALAQVLKAAGASKVSVWVLARAVPQTYIDFSTQTLELVADAT